MKYLPGIVDILRKISPVNLQEDAKKNTHPQYLQ